MNLADSERMAGVLDSAGYQSVSDPNIADVVIYNTCSIREKAEEKVYSAMGLQVKRKRKGKDEMKIVVAGCMANQVGEAILRRVPEVDVIMGPQHTSRIEDLLQQVDLGSQVLALGDVEIEEDIAKPRRDSELLAWVNVIYGCNEHCTYCVVPNARGKEQSRQPSAIYKELLQLGRDG